MIGGPLYICTKCDVQHYDNCPDCWGFGVRPCANGRGTVPVSASSRDDDDAIPCPTCKSTPAGIPAD